MAVTSPPRVALALLPTPLLPAPRLATALGLVGPLLVKRDDLTGFAFGGNKIRQLERLLADAQQQSADVLVTGGAVGSNFVTAAAAAASYAGLRNVVVIAGPARAASSHPNLAAALGWGAEPRWTGDPDRASIDAALPVVAAELAATGARPYVVPRGGANACGASGYRLAYDEVCEQLAAYPVLRRPSSSQRDPAAPWPDSSPGASRTAGRPASWGVSVSRPPEQLAPAVLALAREVALAAGSPAPGPGDVQLVDGRGPGHGLASEAGQAAARAALRAEGLVLDPVYTAKALAALPAVVGTGPALFWHTGGLLDAVAELMKETR